MIRVSIVVFLVILISGCMHTLTKEELAVAVAKETAKLENSFTSVRVPVFTPVKNTMQSSKKDAVIHIEPMHELKVAWIRDYHMMIADEPLYQDRDERLPYIISVNQFKQKALPWIKYAQFKIAVVNHCSSVYRANNIILTTRVDGIDVPDFIAKDIHGNPDSRIPFITSSFSIAPERIKEQVLPIIPTSFFKKESGTVEISMFDIPNCSGSKRKNIVAKYSYKMAHVKLIPPYVESTRMMVEQSQIIPFSRVTKYKTLTYVNEHHILKQRLTSPHEKIENLILPSDD